MSDFTAKPIRAMTTINDGITTLVGAELATQAFGIQAFDFPAGFADYPEHNHAESGQEEVYVVLAGSANVELNGERVAIERGTALRVDSHTTRKLIPGPEGLHVLVIGATPGQLYERPIGLRLPARRRAPGRGRDR